MRVILFSGRREAELSFKPILRSPGFELVRLPHGEIERGLRGRGRDAFVYVDVARLSGKEIRGIETLLAKKGFPYGFLDPSDRVKDVGRLFHEGASDYVGSAALKRGVSPERVERAFGYRPRTPRVPSPRRAGAPAYAASWDEVHEGRQYVFNFLYVELDEVQELRKKMDETQIERTIRAFREFVERFVSVAGGKIWIWNDFSGLVLFPFDGRHSEAVLPCLRMVLSRRIFCAEFPLLNTLLSFRLALHVGSSVYRRRGETGSIISDAVNSVFHLGRKYVEPGNFCMTEESYRFVPECFRRCFRPSGEYEGTPVYRMRLPL